MRCAYRLRRGILMAEPWARSGSGPLGKPDRAKSGRNPLSRSGGKGLVWDALAEGDCGPAYDVPIKVPSYAPTAEYRLTARPHRVFSTIVATVIQAICAP